MPPNFGQKSKIFEILICILYAVGWNGKKTFHAIVPLRQDLLAYAICMPPWEQESERMATMPAWHFLTTSAHLDRNKKQAFDF
jgi:hypothetical protein